MVPPSSPIWLLITPTPLLLLFVGPCLAIGLFPFLKQSPPPGRESAFLGHGRPCCLDFSFNFMSYSQTQILWSLSVLPPCWLSPQFWFQFHLAASSPYISGLWFRVSIPSPCRQGSSLMETDIAGQLVLLLSSLSLWLCLGAAAMFLWPSFLGGRGGWVTCSHFGHLWARVLTPCP